VRPLSPAALAVIVLAGSIAPAAASPGGDPTVGRAVFTGAAAPHPSSIQLNPAALGIGLPGWHFYTSGSGTIDRFWIDRRLLDPESGALSPGPSVSDTTASWGASLALWRVNPAGLLSAFGLLLWTQPAEQYPGDEALRYHSLGGSYRDVAWHTPIPSFAASVAVRPVWWLQIGTSFGIVHSRLDLAFARDTTLEHGTPGLRRDCEGEPCGLEHPAAAERYTIAVETPNYFDGDYVVLTIGALFHLAEDWWIGVSYRSPPGFGSALEMVGTAAIQRPMIDGGKPLRADATVSVDRDFGDLGGVPAPQTANVALRGRIMPVLDLVAGFQFENLSDFHGYEVRLYGPELRGTDVPELMLHPRGLSNVYSLWAGVEQVDIGGRLVVGGRAGFESAAVSANRISPMQVSGLALTADVGVQMRILPGLTVQLSGGASFYPPVDSRDSDYDPRDYLKCVDAHYDFSTPECAQVRAGYAMPTAAGRYVRAGGAARLGIRYDLP